MTICEFHENQEKVFHEIIQMNHKSRFVDHYFEPCIRPACLSLSKACDISSATTWVAQDQLKALAILPDTSVKWPTVYSEGLGDEQSYYLQVFQRLLTPERTTGT